MKVLVACEFSGSVRDAFAARGHDAWSCDLVPSETPGQHYVVDALKVIRWGGWDLLIAHPPCTYLASSGLHWNRRRPGRASLTEDALAFVRAIMDADVPRIAVENPVGCISTRIRKPDQIIHPWQFGHDASKATCLWLKGLPLLTPTNIRAAPAWVRCDCGEEFWCTRHGMHASECDCPPAEEWAVDPYTTGGRWANQTPSGQNRLGPTPTRAAERARAYAGIAEAMASQWGCLEFEGQTETCGNQQSNQGEP